MLCNSLGQVIGDARVISPIRAFHDVDKPGLFQVFRLYGSIMRDEDLLKKAQVTGKVTIGGKDFSIKPFPRKLQEELVRDDPSFSKHEYMGNFSSPPYIPDSVRRNDPTCDPDLYTRRRTTRKPYQDEDRPEVALREGIRAAIRGGLSPEKIKEIFEHEMIEGVMGS
jgi:hypothetical protein